MPSRRCVENALRHHGRQPGETVNFHLTVCLLVGLCWALQIASGAGFGAVSYYYYGRLPEIHGVAVAALSTKVTCAAVGLALALLLQSRGQRWNATRRKLCWRGLAALAATALAAAAFLRWFS